MSDSVSIRPYLTIIAIVVISSLVEILFAVLVYPGQLIDLLICYPLPNCITLSLLNASLMSEGMECYPTLCTHEAKPIPNLLKYCFATAPAITLPIVSRADDLPPPEAALMPYFFR